MIIRDMILKIDLSQSQQILKWNIFWYSLLTRWSVESLSGVICIIYTIYLGYNNVSIRTFNENIIAETIPPIAVVLVGVCCLNILLTGLKHLNLEDLWLEWSHVGNQTLTEYCTVLTWESLQKSTTPHKPPNCHCDKHQAEAAVAK